MAPTEEELVVKLSKPEELTVNNVNNVNDVWTHKLEDSRIRAQKVTEDDPSLYILNVPTFKPFTAIIERMAQVLLFIIYYYYYIIITY